MHTRTQQDIKLLQEIYMDCFFLHVNGLTVTLRAHRSLEGEAKNGQRRRWEEINDHIIFSDEYD